MVHQLREEARAAMAEDIQYDQIWEHKRQAKDKQFTVRQLSEGIFRVEGTQIERWVVQTDWENPESLDFLQHRFGKIGLEKALIKAGAVDGDEIRIVGRAFEFETREGTEDVYRELDF